MGSYIEVEANIRIVDCDDTEAVNPEISSNMGDITIDLAERFNGNGAIPVENLKDYEVKVLHPEAQLSGKPKDGYTGDTSYGKAVDEELTAEVDIEIVSAEGDGHAGMVFVKLGDNKDFFNELSKLRAEVKKLRALRDSLLRTIGECNHDISTNIWTPLESGGAS